MTTPRYLPVATLKDYVRSELQVDDAFYEAAINAAETILDNACQRRFAVYAGGGATARSFPPSGGCNLVINDATTVTTVVDNGTTLTVNVDYRPEPLNNLSTTGEAWPFYRLHRLNYLSWYESTPGGLVVVTGTWGWLAIPPQIVEACKIIAKDVFQQRDIRHGLVMVTEAGGVGTRENRIVRDAVHDYAHPNTIGVA